ncbi:hypothetical protein EPO33_02995 [Patescibacteria group bacterium]|nr:MAG: hypothetical protein EPO33_02995 [Patescibacteria group bacterium]
MRVDRQQTLEEKLDEILKSSQAAQKAAESSNSYLFWMNIGWYTRIVFQIVVVIALIVFGWYILREVKKLSAQLPDNISNINLPAGQAGIPIDVSVNFPQS